MVILAIDTTHPVGSVAMSVDGGAITSALFEANSSHLIQLSQCVDRLLREQNRRIGDVERVALVEGPGSFTGLRVGMAYVKGLAAALDVDVVTVGTLELLAMPALDVAGEAALAATVVCPMVDARKGEVYAAVYGSGLGEAGRMPDRGSVRRSRGVGGVLPDVVVLAEPSAEPPETFLDTVARFANFHPLFVGTGANLYRSLVEDAAATGRIAEPSAAQPSTSYLCRIARDMEPLSNEAVRSLEPAYIRPSGAVLKRLKPIDPNG